MHNIFVRIGYFFRIGVDLIPWVLGSLLFFEMFHIQFHDSSAELQYFVKRVLSWHILPIRDCL